jgi:hypothetical protein
MTKHLKHLIYYHFTSIPVPLARVLVLASGLLVDASGSFLCAALYHFLNTGLVISLHASSRDVMQRQPHIHNNFHNNLCKGSSLCCIISFNKPPLRPPPSHPGTSQSQPCYRGCPTAVSKSSCCARRGTQPLSTPHREGTCMGKYRKEHVGAAWKGTHGRSVG